MIQKVFRAGNSNVIAIPSELAQELGMRSGVKVAIEKHADEDALIVRKIIKKTRPKSTKTYVKEASPVNDEFKGWWKEFIDENGEILDELALR